MDDCTYEDNSEITGRGVLLSFYFQGFLLALNGLLGVDKHELTPSFVTILAICGVLLYEVVTVDSVHLSLVLHLLLCFHVLALHAVIVWVAEKSILEGHHAGGNPGQNDPAHEHSPPWRTWYRIAQFVGLVVLLFSIYSVSYKECVRSVEGFFLKKGLPVRWFLLVTFLPYALCASATWLLHYSPKEGDNDPDGRHFVRLSRPLIHFILIVLWISSLITAVIFLEFTLDGNRHHAVKAGETVGGWSLGQVLPLALAITPAWLFLRNIPTWYKRIKEFTKDPIPATDTADSNNPTPNEQPSIDAIDVQGIELKNINSPSEQLTSDYAMVYPRPSGKLPGSDFQQWTDPHNTATAKNEEIVKIRNTGYFQTAGNIRIVNGSFNTYSGYRAPGPSNRRNFRPGETSQEDQGKEEV